ncbi:FliH/SctL family protein [Conexibacter sp. SYSU D00693]|uniref:FliH/SctL family protein n=1 Tax=Conexibacter sp. SYSU D00693 TaxID=2812560 RepID=UPI00196A3D4E|nr:FliH/SctL family protein [Conexibacter sp. SYSU D00693]
MQDFALPTLEPLAATLMAEAAPARPQVDLEAEAQAAREAGFAAGLEEGRAALSGAIAALQAAAQALADERASVAADCEREAVGLGLRIAQQALSGALEVEPERVVDVVRGALRRLVERGHVTVLVNPDDLDLVRDAAPALVAELGGMEHVEVQAERRVARGGAIVHTAEGDVDASLETKLELARAVVAEALKA